MADITRYTDDGLMYIATLRRIVDEKESTLSHVATDLQNIRFEKAVFKDDGPEDFVSERLDDITQKAKKFLVQLIEDELFECERSHRQ